MIANFAIVLTVLLGCCAIALDIGLLEFKKLQLQNAADAAALGAVYELERGNSDWQAAGVADAALNGVPNSAPSSTVMVNYPSYPSYYWYGFSDSDAVQAVVTQQVPTIFKSASYTMTAQATALLPPCVYLLSSGNSFSLDSSSAQVGCSLYIRGSISSIGASSGAIHAMFAGGPEPTDFSGSFNTNSYYRFSYNTAQTDPLSYLFPLYSSRLAFSPPCVNSTKNYSSTVVLPPGSYCGPLTFNNALVTLQPGLYVIGGGLSITNSKVTGTGITLYMTSQVAGAGYGQFLVSSNSTVSLSAAASKAQGAIPGIVIFGDPNWVATAPEDLRITNSSVTVNGGIIYFPGTGLECSGANPLSTSSLQGSPYFGLVMDHAALTFCETAFTDNYSTLPAGNPFNPKETLAE